MFEVKTVARLRSSRRARVASLSGLPARGQERRETMGPLRAHPREPALLRRRQRPAIYLTGSHTWSNLQDQGPKDPPTPFDYEHYLDFLRERNHNVIRLWAWEQALGPLVRRQGTEPRPTGSSSPNPYARTGPGRARRQAEVRPGEVGRRRTSTGSSARRATGGRAGDLRLGDAVPGLELGQGLVRRHALARPPVPPREQRAGLQREHGRATPAPALDDPRVRERQAAYIRKVVDTLGDLDNVLYEVTNEGGNKDWDRFVVDTVHAYEKTRPKQHPVGLTGHGSENNDEMLASPADWFSPGSDPWPDLKSDPRAVRRQEGQPARHRPRLRRRRRPEVGLEGVPAGPQRAVHGPVRRPRLGTDPRRSGSGRARRRGVPPGDGAREPLRRSTSTSPPAGRRANWPRPGTAWRSPAGVPGLPRPTGGEATVDLSAAKGKLAVEWMHPITGKITAGRAVEGGAKRTLKAPFGGDAVLYLRTMP